MARECHLSLLCKDRVRAPERQTLGKACWVTKHSGLQFLRNVSSFEHRTPKERCHWLKGTSLKAGDEFGARGWIHGSRYTECWDGYSRQSEKLKSDVCDALTAAALCDSELKGIPCCQPFFMPTSCSSIPSGWSYMRCQQAFEEVEEFSKDADDNVRPGVSVACFAPWLWQDLWWHMFPSVSLQSLAVQGACPSDCCSQNREFSRTWPGA